MSSTRAVDTSIQAVSAGTMAGGGGGDAASCTARRSGSKVTGRSSGAGVGAVPEPGMGSGGNGQAS
jgi:hypothetical protein